MSRLYSPLMQSEPAIGAIHHFSGQDTGSHFYLPRLDREHYQGDAVIHWTMPIARRGIGWLNEFIHARFREVMLHAAAREGFFCPAYCLMPDHIHLLWMGLRRDCDQRNGMKFLREHLGVALRPHHFQHQAHDHVLREDERRRGAFSKISFYILANSFRARLIKTQETWPYCGAGVPGYPDLHPRDEDFWPKFWKLYADAREAEAGGLKNKRANSLSLLRK